MSSEQTALINFLLFPVEPRYNIWIPLNSGPFPDFTDWLQSSLEIDSSTLSLGYLSLDICFLDRKEGVGWGQPGWERRRRYLFLVAFVFLCVYNFPPAFPQSFLHLWILPSRPSFPWVAGISQFWGAGTATCGLRTFPCLQGAGRA